MNLMKIDSTELSSKAYDILLDSLQNGMFNNTDKLPSEEELSKMLGISRTVLRDTLSLLEMHGFITRRRGLGTIINKHILKSITRLDIREEFFDEITKAGYVPSYGYINIKTEYATEDIARNLNIDKNEEIIAIEKLILANGQPAIYCIDHFAKKLIMNPNYNIDELKIPIYSFLASQCNTVIETSLTRLIPISLNEKMSKIFNVPLATAFFHLDEIGYDMRGNPKLWALEYYNYDIIKFSILRRKM